MPVALNRDVSLPVYRICEDQESAGQEPESGPQHVHGHADNRY